MIVVRNIKVSGLLTDYLYVSWRIEDTWEDIADYEFLVLRSEAEAGPFEILSEPLTDKYIWRDNQARTTRIFRNYFFRIRVRKKSTGDIWEWGSEDPQKVLDGADPGGVQIGEDPGLVAKEVIHRHRVVFRAYNGRKMWVFPIRTFGPRCGTCWDRVKRQRTRERCPNCYNSGFSGGFLTPVETLMRGGVDQNVVVPAQTFQMEPDDDDIFTADYPTLKPQDIIVTPENHRWRVQQVKVSTVQKSIVSQLAHATRIIRTDVEYDLPLEGIDPIRFLSIDDRQYSMPTNLESLDTRRNRLDPREI